MPVNDYTTERYLAAMEQLASILLRGALHERPTKYLQLIDVLSAEEILEPALAADLKHTVEQCCKYFADNKPERDDDEVRQIKNFALLQYAENVTKGLNFINRLDQTGANQHIHIKDKKNLKHTFTRAIRASFPQIELSQRYKELEMAIKESFLDAIETSGSLKTLAKWQKLGIADRQQLITHIATKDFITAVQGADSEFAQMPAPTIMYVDLPENTHGEYSNNVVHISNKTMQFRRMNYPLIAAVHEGGHHVDHIIMTSKPKSYETDAIWLSRLGQVRHGLLKSTYKDVVYAVTPFEKREFHNLVCTPAIARVDEYRENNRPLNRARTIAESAAFTVTLALRSVMG